MPHALAWGATFEARSAGGFELSTFQRDNSNVYVLFACF
jgi:hypothetical protein